MIIKNEIIICVCVCVCVFVCVCGFSITCLSGSVRWSVLYVQ